MTLEVKLANASLEDATPSLLTLLVMQLQDAEVILLINTT